MQVLFCAFERKRTQHEITNSSDRTDSGKKLYIETVQCTSCKNKETKVTDSSGNLLSHS